MKWNDDTFGFDYIVKNGMGQIEVHSPESYFYEENALAAAKRVVDEFIRKGEDGDENSK